MPSAPPAETASQGGDDDDGADVVHDGQGQEKRTKRRADALAEERENARGECDVGGHRNGPSSPERRRPVEHEIENAGHEHASERGRDGQGRSPGAGELAIVELAANLQAHREEEEGHQAVVDPEAERARERLVRGGPRGVGPQEREGRGDQENRSRRWLAADEPRCS
jgi:hypothetical protein